MHHHVRRTPLVCLWTLLLTVGSMVDAFNLDLDTRLVHKVGAQNWFGFAVSFYVEDYTEQPWLLVGAPTDQSPIHANIRQGGRLYRCSTERRECMTVQTFEQHGNEYRLNGSEMAQMENKSHMWLGATITTSKDGKQVLVCAPRYVYYYMRNERNGPTGYCYLAKHNFDDIEMVHPGRDNTKWGYHRLGYSMFGYSAAFASGDKFFLGGPGSYYWQGGFTVQDAFQPNSNVKVLDASHESHDYRYLGFSTAAGDFDGDGFDDVVLGVPRVDNIRGMVSIYRNDMVSLLNITGEQDGAYFGYCLAVSDIDGDGLDDIIVGAPYYVHYSEVKGVMEPQYDLGRVYVFFQDADHSFKRKAMINGQTARSHFGQAVTAAGDLNQDGYDDFIVGAPYDGLNRRGAIYVYNGKDGGVNEEYSQVIYAENVAPDIKTFGFSLTGGRDVDGNQYPDVAVGAFSSSHAVLFKTNPVIQLRGEIRVDHEEIDLDVRSCTQDNSGVACHEFQICLYYNGLGAPEVLDVDAVITFDALKSKLTSRAKQLATDLARYTETFNLIRDEEHCRDVMFYIDNEIRDKLTPVVLEANFTLTSRRVARQTTQLSPVLDANNAKSVRKTLQIRKDCGPDKICIPDLKISAWPNTTEVILGAGTNLILHVEVGLKSSVSNSQDDAYESQLYLNIPAGLDYAGFKAISGGVGSCSFLDANAPKTAGSTFVCNIGNPLKQDTAVLEFEFATTNVNPKDKHVVFALNVTSANAEKDETIGDNQAIVKVPVKIQAQVKLFGVSQPESLIYSSQDKKLPPFKWEDDIGPTITHVYEVMNTDTTIKGVKLDIYWPSTTPEGDQLLYLLGLPDVAIANTQSDEPVERRVKCVIAQTENVNPYSITIDANRNRGAAQLLMARVKRQVDSIRRATPEDVRASLRQVVEQVTGGSYKFVMDSSQTLNRVNVNCTKMNCTQISCDIGRMAPFETIKFYVHSRMWINTLINLAMYDSQISSVAVAEIESLATPFNYELPLVSTAVTTMVSPSDPRLVVRGIPWWLILLAVLIGLTLLALLVLLLWKLNFFKRNRPPRASATLQGPPQSEHYGFAGSGAGYGGQAGYAPASVYSEQKHGPML